MHVRDLARVAASSEGNSPCGVDHGQPQRNRFDLYQRFTGQALPAGPDAPRERSKLLLRRSVLDLVSDDLNRLRRCVGIADSIRLDQHEVRVLLSGYLADPLLPKQGRDQITAALAEGSAATSEELHDLAVRAETAIEKARAKA